MIGYQEKLKEEIKLDDEMNIKRLWDSLSLNLAAVILGILITVYLETRNICIALISIIVVLLVLKFGKDLFIKLRHFID
jgi:hypothetical protein